MFQVNIATLVEVTFPAGVVGFIITSQQNVFYEVDTGQLDGGATTAAQQQRVDLSTHSLPVPWAPARNRFENKLFLSGQADNQDVWVTALEGSRPALGI
jgi:hypothetical protein